METMVDTPVRQSTALPSISHLESSKSNRDDNQSRRPGQPLTSPSHLRFGTQSFGQVSRSTSGLISPPDSRRTSSEEQTTMPPARQSLPSIHEALGRESALNYPGPPPPPPPSALPTSSSAYFPHSNSTAPSDSKKKEVSALFSPLSSQHSAPPPPPPPPNPPRSTPHAGPPMYQSSAPKIPSLQPIRTGNSPISSSRPNLSYPPPQQAPAPYESSPQSAPPNATFGYSGYQSQYQYPPTSTSAPSYATVPPATMSAPPQYPGWTSEPSGKRELKPLKSYDHSVKRRLDQFDLEASLYELNGASYRLQEVSGHFGKLAKQAKTTGESSTSVVSLEDLENLSRDISTMQRAFARLQEVVHESHAEYLQQQKELQRQYPNMASEQNGYNSEAQNNSGGIPPDPKKRRGRAAPPGRCHSCNRAETPEWRRGPDGARTLCNACGLHYAKLTRKMGPNAKANISSSNLRPKGV